MYFIILNLSRDVFGHWKMISYTNYALIVWLGKVRVFEFSSGSGLNT